MFLNHGNRESQVVQLTPTVRGNDFQTMYAIFKNDVLPSNDNTCEEGSLDCRNVGLNINFILLFF